MWLAILLLWCGLSLLRPLPTVLRLAARSFHRDGGFVTCADECACVRVLWGECVPFGDLVVDGCDGVVVEMFGEK